MTHQLPPPLTVRQYAEWQRRDMRGLQPCDVVYLGGSIGSLCLILSIGPEWVNHTIWREVERPALLWLLSTGTQRAYTFLTNGGGVEVVAGRAA